MGRNLDPKCRQCRRAGEKLFLKGERCSSAKCAMVKKNYPPGLHGQKGFGRKVTEYGKQLQAKQKAKKIFRMSEKQFENLFKEAEGMKGNVSINFLSLLERRFDNVIYRVGLAGSRDQARQMVSHAHFFINDKKVNIPSYKLKVRDKITIRERSKKSKMISELLNNINEKDAPDWIQYDKGKQEIHAIGLPEEKHFDPGIDARLIVEYYSR